MNKILPFVLISVYFVKIFNCMRPDSDSQLLLIPNPKILPLDILHKAKSYYQIAKDALEDAKKQGLKGANIQTAVPVICAGEEEDISKCALKMFMAGAELKAFGSSDWLLTVMLVYKYLLDEAHSFSLCSHYYLQTNNAIFLYEMSNTCRKASNYFLKVASFMTRRIIDRIVFTYYSEDEAKKFLNKDFLNMSLEKFNELFPTKDPEYKGKTIHAIKNLYEYEKYVHLLLEDKSKSCFLPKEEDRLECLLNKMQDTLSPNIKLILKNLELYLETISCKSTFSQNPSLLEEDSSFVLKTHKMLWESLNIINEMLTTNSEDIFDQLLNILFEIEAWKMKAVAEYNGILLVEKPKVSEAANYKANFDDGSSKADFVWTINVKNLQPKS